MAIRCGSSGSRSVGSAARNAVRPLEVVDVEHDREAPRQPGLDGAVHAVGGDGVPAHGQSHEVEPRVADRVEPAVVELQLAAVERPAQADPAP